MSRMIYEFITTSDPMTFVAESDAIAWMAASLLGEGNAGCQREDGKDINTLTAFAPEDKRTEIYMEYIGTENLSEYVKEHGNEIADAFLSFAYGSINERKQYDAAIAAITDPDKMKQFKAQHEETQRTSMSRWVDYAWKLGEIMKCK
jgi:hypothetical protein